MTDWQQPGWAWRPAVNLIPGPLAADYLLMYDGEWMGLLSLPDVDAAADAGLENAELPARWEPVRLAGYPVLSLTGAVAHLDGPPIAWLAPFDEAAWAALTGAALPDLVDGPLRITFPPVPAALPARPPREVP